MNNDKKFEYEIDSDLLAEIEEWEKTDQKMILLQYAKEHRFPNPTFFVDDGWSGTNFAEVR